jgi:hypothetical protein
MAKHPRPSHRLSHPDRAARIIRDALVIESDDVVSYCFPKEWVADRDRRARIIGEWLKKRGALFGLWCGQAAACAVPAEHRRIPPQTDLNRTVISNPTPSASRFATNILRGLRARRTAAAMRCETTGERPI